jgi:Tlde1 domain
MSFRRRQLSVETIALFIMGAVFFGAATFLCVTAYRAGEAPAPIAAETVAELSPALPPAMPPTVEPQPASAVFAPPPAPASILAPPSPSLVSRGEPRPAPVRPARLGRPTSPSIALGPAAPFPPPRPIELNAPLPSNAPAAERRPVFADLGPKPAVLSQYDRFTAVYDLTGHTVYLPDGERLEAHSGLGALKDDPAHVDEADRGATPPHVYDLTLREDLFHGVQALRLNPVGGASAIFGRAGLLAHTYMLGPNGDSNGCVSFKNYEAFLQAYQNGLIKRLAVVSSVK